MITGLHMSNNTLDSEIDSLNNSSDLWNDDLDKLLMITVVYEYEKSSMVKNWIRASSITGHEFINELLNGLFIIYYELFCMDKICFVTFCYNLRRHNYLDDSRDMCLEDMVAITLFIKEKIVISLFILAHNTW